MAPATMSAARPLAADLPLTTLLVDEHALFRVGLRRTLNALGVAVVGEASTCRDAVRLVGELRPDVVVMDAGLLSAHGTHAAGEIVALPDGPPVVLLASSPSERAIEGLVAGAMGLLLKDTRAPDLADAIRRAAAHEVTITPHLAGNLVDRLRVLHLERRRQAVRGGVPLTEREQQVLRLVADGRDNTSIGLELYISASTVKHHVAAILEKLGASNRAQAAAEAVRIGIV